MSEIVTCPRCRAPMNIIPQDARLTGSAALLLVCPGVPVGGCELRLYLPGFRSDRPVWEIQAAANAWLAERMKL